MNCLRFLSFLHSEVVNPFQCCYVMNEIINTILFEGAFVRNGLLFFNLLLLRLIFISTSNSAPWTEHQGVAGQINVPQRFCWSITWSWRIIWSFLEVLHLFGIPQHRMAWWGMLDVSCPTVEVPHAKPLGLQGSYDYDNINVPQWNKITTTQAPNQ